MEIELGDREDVDRLSVPQGTFTRSFSDIVHRTFAWTRGLTLVDGK